MARPMASAGRHGEWTVSSHLPPLHTSWPMSWGPPSPPRVGLRATPPLSQLVATRRGRIAGDRGRWLPRSRLASYVCLPTSSAVDACFGAACFASLLYRVEACAVRWRSGAVSPVRGMRAWYRRARRAGLPRRHHPGAHPSCGGPRGPSSPASSRATASGGCPWWACRGPPSTRGGGSSERRPARGSTRDGRSLLRTSSPSRPRAREPWAAERLACGSRRRGAPRCRCRAPSTWVAGKTYQQRRLGDVQSTHRDTRRNGRERERGRGGGIDLSSRL